MNTLHDSPIDKGKKTKINTKDNGKLTERHTKYGSLKGRIRYYSKELRCYFFLKPGVDFNEVEQNYIRPQVQTTAKVKNDIKAGLNDI